MIVNDIYTDLAGRCALDATLAADKTKMRSALNTAQKEILGKANFWFALRTPASAVITTTSGTSLYMLPADYHKGLFLRQTTSPLLMDEKSPEDFYRDNPSPSTSGGTPDKFILNGLLWVAAQPTSASVIALASTSSADSASVTVTVRGISSSTDIVEEVTLTGSASVSTSASFTYLTAITKETTAGTVVATSNSAGTTNISLLPRQNAKEYWEVRLDPIPNSAYSIYGGYYRSPWELYYDSDVPIIPDNYLEALLARATKILLFNQGDAKYKDWEQKADAELVNLMDANDWMSQTKDERYEYQTSNTRP